MTFLSAYFVDVFLDLYPTLHYMLPQKLTISHRFSYILTVKSARRDLA